MRYIEKLGALVSTKNKKSQKNELLSYKESAMIDQVEALYEQKKPQSQ